MSDSKTTTESLFDEFPPTSTKEWEEVISKDLNGADYKEKLRWDTGEGISPLPFYRRENLSSINRESVIHKQYSDKTHNSWEIRAPIFAHSIEEANKKALQALNRGADGVQFFIHVQRPEGALGGDLRGIPLQNQKDFTDLCTDLSLENTAIHFDAGLASPAVLAMLRNEVNNRTINANNVQATFTYDPFSYILKKGQYPKDKEQIYRHLHQLTDFTTNHFPGVQPLCIDARFYHNTGGTIAQELGYALSAASEYLSILSEKGDNIDDVADMLHFNFSVGSNYFLEIAKLRAARLLWKNLLDAYGGDTNQQVYLHSETSQWNKTLYDPYTNMLRTSTEGMAAAIAGCDAMTVLPFDQHFRQPDEFSQRIARNQQLILSEEAHLDKVADPSAGSYYIEKLTDAIGKEAWKLFQDVEAEGGLFKAIENGTVQSAIHDAQNMRDQQVASRGRTFVGTNQYSNADEEMKDKVENTQHSVSLDTSDTDFDPNTEKLLDDLTTAFADGAQLGDVVPALFNFGRHQITTIAPYRGSLAFEVLRVATEEHSFTPQVLTLPMGDNKWRKARSTFSANFFGCAGYNIEEPIGFENVDAALSEIKEQQPDIVVLCSSDKEYNELVPNICEAIDKLHNRPILVLAGYPKEQVNDFKEAGIDEFIHAKCNVLETLKRFQEKLNITVN
ncbi:methylmalonyl-CoA mutase family protein [Fodinibius saliphilus]|uniref:methylmalonyl-CoA mutase family protein n=1 Tax=Fodinibius saliphilus TaxID=1920650 RepID=UPI00148615E9|nr:methylmalonyl-CoA mutase family protein [Fodinibius saliphilus]